MIYVKAFLPGVLLVAVILVVILIAKHNVETHAAACAARGGVYLTGRGGYLCIDPKALR